MGSADGNGVTMFSADFHEADRPGFAALLSEPAPADRSPLAAEGPGTRAPIGVSTDAGDPAHASAIAAFRRWLDDQREAIAS